MGSPAAHLGRVCIATYDVVRVVLGLILLTAAALKGHQLATEPVAETSLFTSRWFLICVVEFELFFGLWLFCGPYPRRTWQAAILCFTVFACVSLYKAASGEATCGCFGRVPVNPWYTLILDLTAVAGLFCFRPPREKRISPLPFPGEGPGVRAFASLRPLSGEALGMRLGWVLRLFLAAGIPAAFTMGTYEPATADHSGDILGNSQFVVLEPEKWVGKRFPLLKYIDIGDDLGAGQWIVVLYRLDCPSCCDVLDSQAKVVAGSAASMRDTKIAFVQVPSHEVSAADTASRNVRFVLGRLRDVRTWFVRTPVQITLNRGIVVSVTQREGLVGREDHARNRAVLRKVKIELIGRFCGGPRGCRPRLAAEAKREAESLGPPTIKSV